MMRRIRRIALIAAATLALLAVPGAMSARGADTELFGYRMSATASALSFIYNQPSFGIPSDPTFELRKVYSLADLDSGPSGHGLGSLLWPGQVVGNAPASLIFETFVFNPTQLPQLQGPLDQFKEQGSKQFEGRGGYPIRAESYVPQGPAGASQDLAAGARMASTAKPDEVDGTSTTGGAGVPGVITFGSLFSRANSRVENGLAIAESVARVTNFDFLGAIHVDKMVATGRVESDGVQTKRSGSLTISGLTIMNPGDGSEVAKIAVDADGFHAGGQNADPLGKQAADIFKQYLEPNGIFLFAGKPQETVGGASAIRELSGLTIELDAVGMNKLLDGIDGAAPQLGLKSTLKNPTGNPLLNPLFGDNGVLNPTVAGFVASLFQGDQVQKFVFGYLRVETAASPPFSDVVIPPVLPPVLPPALPPVDIPPGTPGFLPPTTGPGGLAFGPLTPVGVKGIPFTYIALAVAVAAFGATRLRLFADRVMAAPAGVVCPLEEAADGG